MLQLAHATHAHLDNSIAYDLPGKEFMSFLGLST